MSPYVTLHFATENLEFYDMDGVIWCVDYAQAHAALPRKLREILDAEGSDVFTAEMLQRAAPTLIEFDAIDSEVFALFFEPPSLDERIVNQFALFSLLSSPTVSLDEWLVSRAGIAHRLIIPAELKWEMRDKLDQANITERVFFPGLDGLSRWLTRYYKPTVATEPDNIQGSHQKQEPLRE